MQINNVPPKDRWSVICIFLQKPMSVEFSMEKMKDYCEDIQEIGFDKFKNYIHNAKSKKTKHYN